MPEAAATTAPNEKCARCGAAFHCGAHEAHCGCAQVALDAPTLARLHAQFGAGCLCLACLREVHASPLRDVRRT
ncbi:MAG: cysteine-rich CWC family protein [Burkholderiales bacterium]